MQKEITPVHDEPLTDAATAFYQYKRTPLLADTVSKLHLRHRRTRERRDKRTDARNQFRTC